MSRGGYRGGSTLVGPGSGWFSRGGKTKEKDLGKSRFEPKAEPKSELERRVEQNLKRNRKITRKQARTQIGSKP
jgi:hypothetical protein